MAQITNCLKIISKLDERDQDALVARLDEIQAHGVPAERAQIQAAIDVMAPLERAAAPVVRSASRQTESPEFRAWFGDSKVVDADGKPLVVFHGTNQSITAFDPARIGSRDAGFFGTGFYFTPDESVAQDYADTAVEDAGEGEATAIPLYASLPNPFIWDMSDEGADATRAALAAAGIQRTSVRGNSAALGSAKERQTFNRAVREQGYDGVIVRDEDGIQEVIAFRPEQIKSAAGNTGAFDPANPDITRSVVRSVDGGFLDGHISGDVAWVNMIEVPSSQRRKGAGRAIYEEWEESLPKSVKLVRLYAADAGDGNSSDFWDALGFSFQYDGDNLDRESAGMMWKGVNGSETPASTRVDDETDDVTRSVARPQFYSQLQRAIEQVPDRLASMAAPQWKLWLDANAPKLGVKKDEIEWSGIGDYLKLRGKDKVTRDEMVAYLEDSGVRVQEVVLGSTGLRDTGEMYVAEANDWGDEWAVFTEDGSIIGGTYESQGAAEQAMDEMNSEGKPTKYGSYTVPGGENYREVLITLPGAETNDQRLMRWKKKYPSWKEGQSFKAVMTEADQAKFLAELDGTKSDYRSSHFDQPNIIAHLRVDDRVDADGARVLFLNEVQSDWSSDGRKKGFDKPPMKGEVRPQEGYDAALADQWEAEDSAPTWAVYWEDGTFSGGYDTKQAAEQRLRDAARSKAGSAPRGPFVEDTKSYVALALKRAIMMAVEEGHDKVALISGEQAAGLYSLDKQVDELVLYDDNTLVARKNGANVVEREYKTDDELADIVGKEVAAKLLATKRDMNSQRILRGNDLKVEATGMRKFYDELIPQVARDVLKKLGGGRLEQIEFASRFDLREQGGGWAIVDTKTDSFYRGDKASRPWGESGQAKIYLSESSAENAASELDAGEPGAASQAGFAITDAMREKVSGGVPLFSRTRGLAGFPDAIIATPSSTQSKDASYEAAKAGDMKAALELVDRVLPADIEQKIRATIGDSKPIVAAVHAEEAAGRNKIPLATAFVIGERMGLQVDDKLTQASRAKRTGASGMARLGVQPEFAGAVEDGADYLLVDDTLAQGGTLAQLKTHIEDNGGRVVGVFALSGKQYSAKLSLDKSTLSDVRAKYESIEDWWERELGFDFAGLTQSEARYIIKSGLSPDALRDQVTAARQAAGLGAGQEDAARLSKARNPQVDTPAFKKWFGDSKVVDASGKPLVMYHGTQSDFSEFRSSSQSRGLLFVSDKPEVANGYAIEGGGWKTMGSAEDRVNLELFLNEFPDPTDADFETYIGELPSGVSSVATMQEFQDGLGEGANVMPLYVRAERPMGSRENPIDWLEAERMGGDAIRSRGYDSVWVTEQGGTALAVLDPAQLKSATGNNGAFEPVNPDITQSKVRNQQTDTPAFKKWFGGSKVVDENGKPVVVYHGRNGDFSRFNTEGGPGKTSGTGAFFSSKPIVADTYATGTEANVAPVYLSLQKPAIFDAQGKNWNSVPQSAKADLPATEVSDQADEDLLAELEGRPAKSGVTRKLKARKTTVREIFKGEWDYADDTASTDDLARWARSQGYDGVIIRNVKDRGPSGRFSTEEAAEPGVIYVAFNPSQIKSAIGNSGAFDPANPNITQSKGRTASGADWESPSASKFDDLVYKFQDKQIETKRVVEAIKEASGSLRDDLNVYLNEEMYHGRAAKRTEDFVNMELDPLVREMAKANMKIADLEEFLHARHAKEANAVIAQRNPGEPALQDGGSGMTNSEADTYMATLPAADRATLEAAAAKVDAIIAGTRKMFVDYELESQNTVDAWDKMFKHYVPLQREDKEGSPGLGQGFSVKGKETKGRTGSTRKVVDILANIAMQRERAIVRGEKNRVAQSLVGLVKANENPDFWLVDEVPTERVFNPATGLVEDRVDPMYKSRDNAVVAKIKDPSGAVREHAVLFNEEDPRALRMAQALKNLDATQLNGLLGVSAKITRYFAAVNTQYNPVFGVVNLVRDVQGAMLNLTSTPLKDDKAKIARYTASALTGIYGDMRAARKGQNQTSKWAALWDEFQEVGGQTGYRDLFATSADRADAIQNSLDPSAWMDSKLGKVFTAGGALKVPLAVAQKQAGFIFDWLSDYNGAMENGVRLAAYKAGLERGLSKQQAASIAKNLTTNFNRKGQTAQQAGAMYAFFNAAIQGTARIGQTLFDMEPGKPKTLRLSSAGKKIVYGGILLGSIQAMALAAAGFGEEDPPEFARERSLIIPTGGKTYVSIPMPLGMHIIPNIGRVATEFALSGFKDPIKRSIGMAAMFADAFNPIGNAGMSMQTLAPTALDPLVALTENKDWTGRPIAKTSFNKATPGHALGRDTATAMSEVLSEAINTLSGGNKYVAGVFSPTPDQIDYLLGQLTGGVGREYSKTEQTLKSIVRGESLPTYKIPLVGRFVGNAKGQASEGSAFYANVDKLNEIETEAKGLRADGKESEARKLLAANPESYLITQANYAERQAQKLRRQKSELIKSGAPREQVKSVEEQITAVMARLNRAMEQLKDKAPATAE